MQLNRCTFLVFLPLLLQTQGGEASVLRTPSQGTHPTPRPAPLPVEELGLADSHPLPEPWAKLGARERTRQEIRGFRPHALPWTAAILLSSEVPTSLLYVGRPRWSVAGEAEPAEGPTRKGGCVATG